MVRKKEQKQRNLWGGTAIAQDRDDDLHSSVNMDSQGVKWKKKKIFQNGNNKYKCRDTRNDRVILENYKLKPYTV